MTPIDKASTPPPASLGDMQLTGLERWLLAQLAVPAQPEPPEGSPGSIQIFRAGKNYYIWSVLAWCAKSLVAVGGLAAMTLAIVTGLRASSDLVRGVIFTVLGLIWLVVIVTLTTTFLARRLTYLLRWYIVTDRSLRIRRGIFAVDELTMTYSNIQEVRVASGPLQLLLGLADVEVQAAGGGGGGERGRRTGHVGRLEGLENANEIRDLLIERLRRYRDAGLGDTPHHVADGDADALGAAHAVLTEARALRAVLRT